MLLLFAAVFAVGWYLTRPAQLAPRVVAIIEASTGAEVEIERSEMRWREGRVSIEGLRLSLPPAAKALAPGAAGEAMSEVFTADRVELKLNVAALRLGSLDLRAVTVEAPTLTVIEHPATGHTNLELLQRARVTRGPPPAPPDALPELRLENAKLRRATVRDNERRLLGEMILSGGVASVPERDGVYRLDLATPATAAAATRLSGEIDLRRLSGAFELTNLDLDPMQRALLPAPLRRVWDKLRPDGKLPRVQLRVSPNFSFTGNPIDVQAEMRLEDLAISLPLDALYAARMTDVSGSLRLREGRLEVHDLRGDVEGIRYGLNGWIDAASPRSRFNLEIATERFEVPSLPTIIPALPPAIQRSYRRLSPSGAFRFQTQLKRAGPEQPVQYEGRVDVLDATARYEKFPYPAEHLEGVIRFSSQSVIIERLTGQTAGGGSVDITGSITPPGEGARVEMTVQLRGVPLDQRLLAAMEPGHREAVDMLLHRPSIERLREAGLIRDPQAPPAAGRAADGQGATQGPPYPFRPGGILNADVDVFRPRGDDSRYNNTTTIYLEDLAGVFQYFPVPITARAGTVRFNRDKIEVRDAVARTPAGATVRAHGTVTGHGQDDGPLTPELKITADGGRVNDLLLFAIPDAQARQIRELRLRGEVAAEARIFRDAERDRIAFEVEGRLEEGAAQPFDGDVAIEAIRGDVRVTNDGFDLAPIQARLGEGEVEVRGAWRLASARPPATQTPEETDGPNRGEPDRGALADIDATLRGRGVRVHEGLADLLPPDTPSRAAILRRIGELQPEGLVDFQAKLARPVRQGKPGPLDFDVTVEPRRLAFTLDERRLAFRDMTGSMRYEDRGIELDRLRGTSEEGTFAATGLIDLTGEAGIALSLAADCSDIGPVLRTAVPERAMAMMDELVLSGAFETRSARLRVIPNDAPRSKRASTADTEQGNAAALDFTGADVVFEADLSLNGVSATVGVPIENLHGDAQLRVRTGEATPRVSFRLDADRAEVFSRRADRVRLRVSNHRNAGRFDVVLRGQAAGGVLLGEGIAEIAGPHPGYRLRLDLLEAEVDPLLHPEDPPPATTDRAADTAPEPGSVAVAHRTAASASAAAPVGLATRKLEHGVATASLTVDGSFDDPTQRRGRGAIAVREAKLFDAPLGLAILQSVNLALPDSRSFDQVACRWTLDGDLVTIDELAFETPSFAVTGAGFMRLPSTALDLQMVTRVPGRSGLGKLGDAFNLFKDELIDIRITGTLDDPDTRVVSFRGLRNTWLRLFGGDPSGEPQPPPVEPSP